jgi:hypothetical protein
MPAALDAAAQCLRRTLRKPWFAAATMPRTGTPASPCAMALPCVTTGLAWVPPAHAVRTATVLRVEAATGTRRAPSAFTGTAATMMVSALRFPKPARPLPTGHVRVAPSSAGALRTASWFVRDRHIGSSPGDGTVTLIVAGAMVPCRRSWFAGRQEAGGVGGRSCLGSTDRLGLAGETNRACQSVRLKARYGRGSQRSHR